MATYEFRIRNRMERFTYAEKVEAAIWLLRNKTLGWSYHYIMYHVTDTRVATPTFCTS